MSLSALRCEGNEPTFEDYRWHVTTDRSAAFAAAKA